MLNKKKATAIILGLTMGISGTAMAAPADSDMDARIAALEKQQQELTKQLASLKKQNKELRKGVNTAKSNKGAISALKEAQNRIQIKGFGRLAWDNDNINDYANRNDFRRTYLDLEAKYKVNDRWNMNFQAETAQRYAKYVTAASGSAVYHPKDADGKYDNEHGTIQRVWAEGSVGKLNLDIGRRWRGMGYTFAFFGNESDGVVASTQLPKSPLTAEAFYLTPTDRGFDFSVAGLGLKGRINPKVEMRLAYGKLNVGKNERLGINYYDQVTKNHPNYNSSEFVNKVGETPDGEPIYSKNRENSVGTNAFLIGAMINPIKNIYVLGDYVHTNRERKYGSINYDGRDAYAIQMNYRWPDLNSKGSFQLYTRYFNYPNNENDLVGIFGDKQDGAFHAGNRGWVFGFKYVPARNIEWDTFYMKANATKLVWGAGRGEQYHHNMLRTRVDFHF